MRSVLDCAGLFLYLGYRVIMLPLLSVLYALLFVFLTLQYVQAIGRQVPLAFAKSKTLVLAGTHVLRQHSKHALSNLLHKTWAFSNHQQ